MLGRFVDRFRIAHIDRTISMTALRLVRLYAKSHTLDIPDALIAATALDLNSPLFTYNRRDFRYIEGLELV